MTMAHGVAVAAAVVLGGVFLFAGVAKLAGATQWRRQAAGLGVPPALATAMPLVEVLLGACLVAQVQRRLVAVLAAVLLVAFTAVLAARLGDDQPPPCACFGGLSDAPISWRHIARNSALVALAAAAALVR